MVIGPALPGAPVASGLRHRMWLAPASRRVTAVLAAVSIAAAGAARYDVYLIGDSRARATRQDGFSTSPLPARP